MQLPLVPHWAAGVLQDFRISSEARLVGAALPPAFHEIRMPDGTLWSSHHRLPEAYLVHFPELADFRVAADGRRIHCMPMSGVASASVEHLLLNHVVPLAYSRRGRLALHASAAAVEGQVLAFLGASGQGKSTLAAAFAAAGHPFLTDDGVILSTDDQQVLVHPGPASLRLWEDSLQALGPPSALATAAELNDGRKAHLCADGELLHCNCALPLAALYFLDDSDHSAVSIQRLGGQDCLLRLLQHCFVLDLEARDLLQQSFLQFTALVRRVPAFLLGYPREYGTLPALVQQLAIHAGALARDANQAKFP